MESAQADTTAAIFMQSAVKYGSLSIAMTCLLGSFGFNINGLTAALTSMGLAIGLASQRVLENLAAGIMLMVFRNFQVGDIVQVSGKLGVVCKITLLATRIDTFSNVRMSIPNKDIFGSIVENFSRNSMRRAEVEIGTAGSSDIATVRKVLEAVCANYADVAVSFIDADKRRKRGRVLAAKMGADAIAKARTAATLPPPAPPTPVQVEVQGAVNGMIEGSGQPGCVVTEMASQTGDGALATREVLVNNPQESSSAPTKGKKASLSKMVLMGPRKLLDQLDGMREAGGQLSLFDFLSVTQSGESKDEQSRTGVAVSLPLVILKDIKTWGYLWEVRVFVPGARFETFRCRLVEDIAMALKKNNIRIVADIVEERKKVVGL